VIAAFSPFLALRYLLTRRINLLAVFGVTFAVWAIVLVDSVFTGFVGQIRDDVRGSAPDLLVTSLPHDTGYEQLRAAIEADGAVAATAPRLRHHGLLQPLRTLTRRTLRTEQSQQVDFDHTAHGFALLLGVDWDREQAVTGCSQWLQRAPEQLAASEQRSPDDFWTAPLLHERDPARRQSMLLPDEDEWAARERAQLPRPADAKRHEASMPGVLFGWARVRRMRVQPAPAEPFDLLCASFTGADGAAQLQTDSDRLAFAGMFATGYRTLDETTVIVPIDTLRTLLGHDAADPRAVDLVTDVAVRVRPGTTPAELAAAKARLQAAVQALLGAGAPPCLVVDWVEQNEVFLSAVAHEQGMMQFVLFVVMLVAAFVIYATLHMMVVQKVKDIGILSSLGGSPRAIGAVFLIGGLAVGITGTVLGVAAGVGSALGLNTANEWMFARFGLELFPRRLFDLREVPCRLEPSWIAVVAIGAVVLALVVAAIPSHRAARMDPVEALSHE
jgi:ABC-type lipoprotein release transport system permease subunit